jgi:uncharacterized protein YjbI with pentapeptide repeats
LAVQRDREPPFLRWREERRRAERAVPKPPEPAPSEREHDQDQDWLIAQAEKRLAAANDAIGTTRTFFFVLLSVAAYIGVVVASTTDEQILRIAPVTLPIIGVEVPLTGFYVFVPWLFLLLHFHLLIHLCLTSYKLRTFLEDIQPLDARLSRQLRNDVANFPLAQWMVGDHDAVLRTVLTLLVWIVLVLIPPFLLLWMQLRFLAFQDELFTWLQALAVAVDALLIISFRVWFVRNIQPRAAWVERAKESYRNRGKPLFLWLRLVFAESFLCYLVPLVPLMLAVYLGVTLTGILGRGEAMSGKSLAHRPADLLFPQLWNRKLHRLDLKEKILTHDPLTPAVINALLGDDDVSRRSALKNVLGLELRERNQRETDYSRALLPKADLRGADLHDAVLYDAQLQGANLTGAHLQGANIEHARLEGAAFAGAELQRVRLSAAHLRGADLTAARLQNAVLLGAQLQGANLFGVELEDASLVGAQLQGADVRAANFEWADLTDADLTFANLEGVKNLDTAELAGADYVFADGLEGTFLDVNQPPPDVLPAP